VSASWRWESCCAGGGDGNRTHDLFDATEALCQLSYAPDKQMSIAAELRRPVSDWSGA
jgi:hypothetical protein